MQFFVAEGMIYVMGTLLRATIQGTQLEAVESGKDLAFQKIRDLEEALTVHRPESDISRLNRGEINLADLSRLTTEAITLAQNYSVDTQGYFSPCRQGQWDLGAFGKGFALDKAQQLLIEIPEIFSFRLDFGGQLLFWDREDHVQEIVRIELPKVPVEQSPEFVMKRRGSISTSAPFERGHHILNPKTGDPMDVERSVTVIASSGAMADAWSTALYVCGPDLGLPLLAQQPTLQALFLEWTGDRFQERPSPGWPVSDGRRFGPGSVHSPFASYNRP